MESARASFDTEKDAFILSKLHIQQREGKRGQSGFKKSAWREVTNLFNTEFNSTYTVGQIKGRQNMLKRQFKQMNQLRNSSGFGWDAVGQTVTANDDVWEEYLEKHPQAIKLKGKPFLNYDEMSRIFGDHGATGDFALSSQAAILQVEDSSSSDDDEGGFQGLSMLLLLYVYFI